MSDVESLGANMSVRNMFVYFSPDDDGEHAAEQSMPKDLKAESPKTWAEQRRSQFSSVVEETVYMEDVTLSDGAVGIDEQDAESSPMLVRYKTRDSFESPMACDSFESPMAWNPAPGLGFDRFVAPAGVSRRGAGFLSSGGGSCGVKSPQGLAAAAALARAGLLQLRSRRRRG